jgi:hypothetical protein
MRSSLRSIKSMKGLENTLTQKGWRLRDGKKHHVWYCPCGEHILTLPQSGAKRGDSFTNYVKHADRTCLT